MEFKELKKKDSQTFLLLKKELGEIEFINFFSDGSTARVYHIRQPIGPDETHKIDRIVKVFRPKSELAKGISRSKLFRNEIDKLVSVTHTNLISMYSWSYVEIEKEQLPYYVMEYVDGATDVNLWIDEHIGEKDREVFLGILLQIAEGLHAMHLKEVIHCDIKYGNTIVGGNGIVKVADLGFAKSIKRDSGKTQLFTTLDYLPEIYRKYEERMDNRAQTEVKLPRSLINPTFDIHYFGKMVESLLKMTKVRALFDESDMHSLNVIISRMLLDKAEKNLGNPLQVQYSEMAQYTDMRTIISDLSKLKIGYVNPAGIKELSTYTGTRAIRIPVSGSVPFSKRVEKIISHPYFLRLSNSRQLGFTSLVYPGANHTRYEHCLGVFSNVSKYINALLADDLQAHFRHHVDEKKISTTLLAGLLHDVGQHSFAHGLEDVGLAESHESISARFITGNGLESIVTKKTKVEPLITVIEKYWPDVNMEALIWLITGKGNFKETDIGWDFMEAILSGPIDADKTDYLLRDAHHAGVEYANSIDITRFMNSLSASIYREKEEIRGVLAITWKGRQSAENIVLARSQMFWVLYWHHAVRCAHAMLAHACDAHLKGLGKKERLLYNETLYFGSTGEFLNLLEASANKRTKQLSNALRRRVLYKRAMSLDHNDAGDIYDDLAKKAAKLMIEGDKVLYTLSESIADIVNREMNAVKGTSISPEDIIVDIPKPGKDKLGEMYEIQKNSFYARKYISEGLSGNHHDWQNRVRTIRVFINPNVGDNVRKHMASRARRILKTIADQ